jgi:hypothetical protein
MTNKIGPYFCTAPWTHTYVSPQGERRLCCASREDASFQRQYIDAGDNNNAEFKPVSLKEHWNSKYMKDIRKRILTGEKISQCDVCNNQVLNLHTYKNYFTNTMFPHKIEDIIANTDKDGYTTMQPISYDYRISNLCNFKCRMCGEQLSSSWETEKIKYNLVNYNYDKWMSPNIRKEISTFQTEVLETELQEAVDNGIVEELYWVGGEPLMYDIHWRIMKQLVDNGQSQDVVVRYNTNLSRIHYKEHKLYNMLDNFKNVNICASIDGVGNVGEYIRTGLNWNKWLQNFKEGMFLIDKYGDNAIVFDVTLTTPGLFDLKNMFDTVTELNVKSYFKITFAFDSSVLMSPMCLPRNVLDEQIHDLLKYIKPRVTHKTFVYQETLENMLNRPTFEQEFNDYKDGWKKGKNNILFLESIRQQSVTFREILSDSGKQWWDSIE